jgi:superfamily II DNA or RNA helicase
MTEYDNLYFLNVDPFISDNDELREPQKNAFELTYDHFITNKSNEHAIIVLPTGCGKTGLIGLLPYGIAKGRVLVITPQLVIKDGIIDSLDPEEPRNFWLERSVFSSIEELPILIEYEGKKTPIESLEEANFTIVNIQKLQERLKSSLLKRLPSDFYDMIIIDEAHHSAAKTWEDAVEHFKDAKIIKLTGTPYRTDKKPIVGKNIYEYGLAAAMANNYIKSLEKFKYNPQKLYLTIDKDESKIYTVEQIRKMGIKDEDWINRSVAYSKECNEAIIDECIATMEHKRSLSGLPHKIIAVTCSIKHAEDVAEICTKKGYRTALIHSKLESSIIKERFKNIENDLVDVVINVAKLGEGYDHKYLSVAAILRPFKGLMPYAQFIGRVLRFIPLDKATQPGDNVAAVFFHRDLGIDKLWDYYKDEIEKGNIIRWMTPEDEIIDKANKGESDGRVIDKYLGLAKEEGHGFLTSDTFIDTKLIELQRQRQEEERKKLNELKQVLPDVPDRELLKFIRKSQTGQGERILRPDKYIARKKKEIDDEIKVVIIPEIIVHYKIEKEGNNLKNTPLFKGKYRWISNGNNTNVNMLSIYFEVSLNDAIGKKSRDYFTLDDYNISIDKLREIKKYVINILNSSFGRRN